MGLVKSEEKDFFEVFRRIKKRDFSGNTGIAVKNSFYQTLTNVIGKLGTLVFTIIVARLLLAELYGLYSLALSTVLLFSTISSLGIGEALITLVSRELGRSRRKMAAAYAYHLARIKIILVAASVIILVLLSKFIAQNYYQKPIFLALLAGSLYIVFFELVNFLGFIFQSSNFFKGMFEKEIVLQVSRLLIVPLTVLFVLKTSASKETILFYLILSLTTTYVITGIFMAFLAKKESNISVKKGNLNRRQLSEINKFLIVTAPFVLSGMFFSYIDKIILGPFVAAEFIGYYSAALNLVSSLSVFVGFGSVLLPLFARLERKRLEKGMKKSLGIVFTLGICLSIITFFFSPMIIKIAYGSGFTQSIGLLKMFSVFLIIMPLISIYSVYFISLKKPQVLTKLLFASILLNMILTYLLVRNFVQYGDLAAVFGAGIAGILSQTFYLLGLMFFRNR